MKEEEKKQKQLMEAMRMVAPGTPLREGLENILRGKMGALIVFGDSEAVMNLVPSALAVLRLRTSSNVAGRSSGRSAGLAPLRILAT